MEIQRNFHTDPGLTWLRLYGMVRKIIPYGGENEKMCNLRKNKTIQCIS